MSIAVANPSASKRPRLPVVMVIGELERAEMRPVTDWLELFAKQASGGSSGEQKGDRREWKVEKNNDRPISSHLSEIYFLAKGPPPDSSVTVPTAIQLETQIANAPRQIDSSPANSFNFPDIPTALGVSLTERFPDMIIVLQSGPNEYSRDEVNRLLAFAPLARVVVCYGAWCESDGRNHNIWPQSVRIPVWAAKSRIEREWRLIQNPSNLQPLPWSASREEAFAADHPPIMEWHPPQSFLIDSPDHAYRQSLIEIMVAAGHTLVHDSPTRILFDADPWGTARAAALRTIKVRHSDAAVIALLSLPEPSVITQLHDLGVATSLCKLGFQPV